MIILAIKTDQPQAFIALYNDNQELASHRWEAGKQLAESLHQTIKDLLQKVDSNWQDIDGVVGYSGPGSFTGLRIGLTAANTLAYAQNIPIVGEGGDEDWLLRGIERLENGQNDTQVVPEYGADPHITAPKH